MEISEELKQQLHCQDPAYIQAVANAGYLVVKRLDDMFDEMMSGEAKRVSEYMEAAIIAKDDILEALHNPDVQVLDYLAEEIIPTIGEMHNLTATVVTADVNIFIDYYSMASTLDSLNDV